MENQMISDILNFNVGAKGYSEYFMKEIINSLTRLHEGEKHSLMYNKSMIQGTGLSTEDFNKIMWSVISHLDDEDKILDLGKTINNVQLVKEILDYINYIKALKAVYNLHNISGANLLSIDGIPLKERIEEALTYAKEMVDKHPI